VQFAKPISSFQAISFKMADMATELEAAELMLLRAAIEDVQVFGGYGYIKEYPAECHMRDAKICRIYE
jgi:alkylation response protein AidB-like acyl-CoA dehydrogenase